MNYTHRDHKYKSTVSYKALNHLRRLNTYSNHATVFQNILLLFSCHYFQSLRYTVLNTLNGVLKMKLILKGEGSHVVSSQS